LGWDEAHGRVSRAFGAWRVVDRDQRAFLSFGLRMAHATYDRLWRETSHEPGEAPKTELVDLFDGLWPREYEAMHAASVLRDAVTNFEVYLERARAEIRGDAVDSPRWDELGQYFGGLGVAVESSQVRAVRELGRVLTLERGRAVVGGGPVEAVGVELDEDDVLAAMDVLAEQVRRVDPAVYRATRPPCR
jgi:hypothetical protein